MTQLGFADLLSAAAEDNARHQLDKATSHLPGSMAEAVPFYRGMIDQHHAAMLACDIEQAMAIRKEAHTLAVKLNGGKGGILADDDAPGRVLARETAAPDGVPPLWGQEGSFTVTVGLMRVRIEMRGMFGIGATYCLFPHFAAHAVDRDQPFLSETGYRSFMGLSGDLIPGVTPEAYAIEVCAHLVRTELRGKLVPITRL